MCHAFPDETRLDILDRIKEGERCACELTDALQAGQSQLSFHLKVLKDAGLIYDRPEGCWICYSINSDAVEELKILWYRSRPWGDGLAKSAVLFSCLSGQ
jgi:ArsR family transcriptional regulator